MVAGDVTRAASTQRARADIVQAARALLAEHGPSAVSLRDIAAAAGISHPGLLKHFKSKEAVIKAVLLAIESELAAEKPTEGSETLDGLIEIAEKRDRVAGFISIVTLLTAGTMGQSVRAKVLLRQIELREAVANALRRASNHGEIRSPDDIDGEARRITAAWRGLEIISLYLPDQINVQAEIAYRLQRLRGELSDIVQPLPDATPLRLSSVLNEAHYGYKVGRRRRAQIIDDAMVLFAKGGFHDTSLREIAARVEVSPSTLLHYFGTKEELLAAVLRHRDGIMVARRADALMDPKLELQGLGDDARRDMQDEPGLIELYAVLSTEAAAASHPAHGYFRDRYQRTIAYFQNLIQRAIAAGNSPRNLDPRREAAWLVALWDGLQIAWRNEPDTVDVAADLEAFVANLVFS